MTGSSTPTPTHTYLKLIDASIMGPFVDDEKVTLAVDFLQKSETGLTFEWFIDPTPPGMEGADSATVHWDAPDDSIPYSLYRVEVRIFMLSESENYQSLSTTIAVSNPPTCVSEYRNPTGIPPDGLRPTVIAVTTFTTEEKLASALQAVNTHSPNDAQRALFAHGTGTGTGSARPTVSVNLSSMFPLRHRPSTWYRIDATLFNGTVNALLDGPCTSRWCQEDELADLEAVSLHLPPVSEGLGGALVVVRVRTMVDNAILAPEKACHLPILVVPPDNAEVLALPDISQVLNKSVTPTGSALSTFFHMVQLLAVLPSSAKESMLELVTELFGRLLLVDPTVDATSLASLRKTTEGVVFCALSSGGTLPSVAEVPTALVPLLSTVKGVILDSSVLSEPADLANALVALDLLAEKGQNVMGSEDPNSLVSDVQKLQQKHVSLAPLDTRECIRSVRGAESCAIITTAAGLANSTFTETNGLELRFLSTPPSVLGNISEARRFVSLCVTQLSQSFFLGHDSAHESASPDSYVQDLVDVSFYWYERRAGSNVADVSNPVDLPMDQVVSLHWPTQSNIPADAYDIRAVPRFNCGRWNGDSWQILEVAATEIGDPEHPTCFDNSLDRHYG